jgi:hypothetical protein
MLELPPYEDDVEMTEQQEEELLREAPEPGAEIELPMMMMGNPFLGVPTPQQREFLDALQEGAE